MVKKNYFYSKKRSKKFFNSPNFIEIVPSKNPKHGKKLYYERKKQYEKQKIPVKYIAMGVIFVLSITGVVLLAIFLPDSPIGHGDNLFIEDGDSALIHYKLWIDGSERDGIIDIDEDPEQENTLDFDVVKGATINGFYYEMLDLEIGEISRFRIEPNVDLNGDGIDDLTDEEVLGYGNQGHALFNMSIYYWIQVINITKSEETAPASANFAIQVDNISENYLYCSFKKLFSFEFLENY